VVLAIGYDIAEFRPEGWNSKKNKKIVHIDFEVAEVDAHYQPEVEIVADIPATLRELNKKLAHDHHSFDNSWYKAIRKRMFDDIAGYTLKEGDAFTIPGVLNILQSIMTDDDLLISDVGSHKIWVARNFSACCPNGCIISNGLASMGIALPGAIAAALLSPGRRIVAVMGDGGFLMNSQELETAKRLKIGFTTIIFNDNDYGLISWKQQTSRGQTTGTKIANPDFKLYAESFGIKGYRPQSVDELTVQLRESIRSKELCVFEILIDTRVNAELIAKSKRLLTQTKD
jgi:acetolactate synthase-1/2/3 large subunit